MKIGDRIRKRRTELNLSLRELGARTQLTAGFLSQLENDQVSPSLNSLQAIATALQVPMFYFLKASQPQPISRAAERRKLYFPDSKMGYDLLTPDLNRQMMPILITMEPGSRRNALPLAKPTEQWIYVIQGHLEITIDDETYLLEPGDAIYYDGDRLQEFGSASNNEELQMICCILPPVL